MAVAVMVVIAVVLVSAGAAAGRMVRERAVRIQRSDADKPERVHRLQRLFLAVVACYVVGFTVLTGLIGALAGSARHHHDRAVWAAVVGGAGLVALALAMIVSSRAIRRAIASVRDTKLKTPGRRRQIAAAAAVGLTAGVVFSIGRLLVPRHGAGHLIGLAAVYVLGLLLLISVVAPLLVVRISSKSL